LSALSVVALACAALAACGSSSAGTGTGNGSGLCGNLSQVDGLVVQRVNPIPQNHLHFTFPAKATVSDQAEAQAVARAVCALPVMPSGNISCPGDTGIMYRLTFTAGGQKLPAVDVKASGCGQVSGLGQTRWTARSPGFWRTLGVATGIAHPDQSAFGGYRN
jgi:hypothetical protein